MKKQKIAPKGKIFAVLAGLLVMTGGLAASEVRAAPELPQAAGSPLAGIGFDDRPLLLPVQRNFQMAMLTASSELGRSCGKMEVYGWRMKGNEQQRVNQIFNNTVDRLRAQGFIVETQTPSVVSQDVTVFTADRPDKHLIFMWSAGEIGLVSVLCETSAPLPASRAPASYPGAETYAPADKPEATVSRLGKPMDPNFTPLGDWVGSYICTQGTTGATLHISRVRGEQFEGSFSFYPTPKNPYVPSGRYKVFGQYDRDTQRILINPGEWLQRPKNYYNTIIIGSFDSVGKTFSGFFQGISGCTSFEAKYAQDGGTYAGEDKPSLKKKAHKAPKVHKAHKKTKKASKAKKNSSNSVLEKVPAESAGITVETAPQEPKKEELKAPIQKKGPEETKTPTSSKDGVTASPDVLSFVPAEAPRNLPQPQAETKSEATPVEGQAEGKASPAESQPAVSPETNSTVTPSTTLEAPLSLTPPAEVKP